jgi:hypothetical protein
MAGGKNYRSASSGRFVTKGYATRAPSKTVAETRGGGSRHGANRSAITGRFVTESTARRHPDTTIKDN